MFGPIGESLTRCLTQAVMISHPLKKRSEWISTDDESDLAKAMWLNWQVGQPQGRGAPWTA